jgi:hypothetical protein
MEEHCFDFDLSSGECNSQSCSSSGKEGSSVSSMCVQLDGGELVQDENVRFPFAQSSHFLSFKHLKSYLESVFHEFGLRVRVRDTHYAGKGRGEEDIVRRKFQCATKGCKWFAWYAWKEHRAFVGLNKRFHLVHSHDLKRSVASSVARNKPFTHDEKALLDECKSCRLQPIKTRALLQIRFGRIYDDMMVRNYLRKGRKKEVWSDVGMFVGKLSELERESGVFYSVGVDEDTALDKVFIGLPSGVDDFKAHGQAIGIDATYETNRYALPLVTIVCQDCHGRIISLAYGLINDGTTASYVWLLQQFLRFTDEQEPSLVISDGDGAIAAAVSTVFERSTHRLCWWHLRRNIRKNMRGVPEMFLQEMLAIANEGVKEYAIERFDIMAEKHNVADHKYVSRLRELMPKWSDAFLPATFLGRVRSTQGNESQHARLKKELSSVSTLCEILDVALQIKEHETNKPITVGVVSVPILSGLKITSLAASILDIQLKMSFHCVSIQDSTSDMWNVTHRGYSFIVTDLISSFSCSCGFPIRMKMPCAHILSVMMSNQTLTDVPRYIDSYWVVDSKRLDEREDITVVVENVASAEGGGDDEELVDQDVQYSDLVNLVKKLFSFKKDGDLTKSLSIVHHIVEGEIKRLKKIGHKPMSRSFSIDRRIMSPPEQVSSGHPTKRRKIGAAELHERACRHLYGADFVTSSD